MHLSKQPSRFSKIQQKSDPCSKSKFKNIEFEDLNINNDKTFS